MFDTPQLERALENLTPTGRRLVEATRRLALEIHADEVGREHLLMALMKDEDCAAHRAVVHAFADPETIAAETLAMASGILVSGSAASLPFSPRGVRALEAARALAAERDDGAIREAHLLMGAVRSLPEELAAEVEAAGWSEAGLDDAARPPRTLEDEPQARARVATDGPLFRQFTEDAKRVLSAAARTARTDGAPSIGPAHLLLACLGTGTELPRAAGISASRARAVLRGRSHDGSAPDERPIAADDGLESLFGELGPGAGSLDLLERVIDGGGGELGQLLARHRVTPALIERVRGAFED